MAAVVADGALILMSHYCSLNMTIAYSISWMLREKHCSWPILFSLKNKHIVRKGCFFLFIIFFFGCGHFSLCSMRLTRMRFFPHYCIKSSILNFFLSAVRYFGVTFASDRWHNLDRCLPEQWEFVGFGRRWYYFKNIWQKRIEDRSDFW